jgi:hypothetical protein
MLAATGVPGETAAPPAPVTVPKNLADGTLDGPPTLVAGVAVPVWAFTLPPRPSANAPAMASTPVRAARASTLFPTLMHPFLIGLLVRPNTSAARNSTHRTAACGGFHDCGEYTRAMPSAPLPAVIVTVGVDINQSDA